jgi:hypothetical protein
MSQDTSFPQASRWTNVPFSFTFDRMTNSPRSQMNYHPRIGQSADDRLLIVCRCDLCRRTRIYLATDLVEIYHPDTFLADLFGGRCPRCESSNFWHVRQRFPSNSDVGMLKVRRPAGVKRIQLWRDELYSAPPKPESPDAA